MTDLPILVFHMDWSSQPAKRWMAWALRISPEAYQIHAPILVSSGAEVWDFIRALLTQEESALIGCDFPIGLPLEYARKINCENFLDFLAQLEDGVWPDFFRVADQPEDIALERPFYPARSGGKRLKHLVQGLGFSRAQALWRLCDRATPYRRAAAPLFWALGAQQVGKAALSGWRELLIPARHLTFPQVKVWPFQGLLQDLLRPSTAVIAETYPAEYYVPLGLNLHLAPSGSRRGKRSLYTRQANASRLLRAMRELGGNPTPELEEAIQAGFGTSPVAEDAFDALVGLLGMLMVLRGELPANPPAETPSTIEGWIFGLRIEKKGYNEIGLASRSRSPFPYPE